MQAKDFLQQLSDQAAYRAILKKVLAENREIEFFENMWSGGSVTMRGGELVFISAEQLNALALNGRRNVSRGMY